MQFAGESTLCRDIPVKPSSSFGKSASSNSAEASRRSSSSAGPSVAAGVLSITGNASSNPTVSQSHPPTLSCRRLSCPSSCEAVVRSSSFYGPATGREFLFRSMPWLRSINILQRDTTVKDNIRGKRMRAGWDDVVLDRIYAGLNGS